MEDNPFLKDVMEQPTVLSRLLSKSTETMIKERLARIRQTLDSGSGLIIFSGMGSSHFAAIPAVAYLDKNGIPAMAVPSSFLIHHQRSLLSLARLLIMVSQSGESVEVVRLMEEVKASRNSLVSVGVTNEPESQLAHMADLQLYLGAGSEATVTSKTYTASVMLLMLLAEGIVQGSCKPAFDEFSRCVEQLSNFLSDWRPCIESAGDFIGDPDYLCLIGRGPSLATVHEGALILKELAKLPAEGLEAGAFRHGPLETVDEGFSGIVVAYEGPTCDKSFNLAVQIADCGGRVLLISNACRKVEHPRIEHISVANGLSEYRVPIVDIVPIQLLAAHLAAKRGFKTGQFRHIAKVTKVE